MSSEQVNEGAEAAEPLEREREEPAGERPEGEDRRREGGELAAWLLERWRDAKTWFLITGPRRNVTLTLAAGVYLALLALSVVWPFELQQLLSEAETVQRLFNTLLSGVILLISIVVSINSIVVSDEIQPIGEQHDQVVKAWEFREHTAEDVSGDVSAADPDRFLQQILESVDHELRSLVTTLKPASDEDEESLRQFYRGMKDYVRSTQEMLRDATDGPIDTRLFSAAYDPSDRLAEARQLQRRESLPPEAAAVLEEIVDAFHFFTAAREYFRTLYYKREFARLSRDILYAGLPAILLMSYVLLALDTQSFPGSTFGVAHLLLFVNLTYVVALTPFLLLMSYVLRSAVVAEHIITAGAFTVSGNGRK